MAAENADPSLVEKFVNITGAEESRAEALLNACNGNLEMAIGMYLEESVQGEDSSSIQEQSVKQSDVDDENVRAPIPQTRGVLLEGPYRANRPIRRGNQSVFDAFRDFQAEAILAPDYTHGSPKAMGTILYRISDESCHVKLRLPKFAVQLKIAHLFAREQELELSGRMTRNKRKTLQDLFKPPLDIMHKGTFDTAKVAGEQEGKWLMVNIQDSKEFSCQQLNRDVWSNEAVRSIMAKHFILWQVYHDSDDGDRYTQFYHVSKFPHLAILDPRTGEKLVDWDGIDAQSFSENAAEFLSSHSLGDNTNCLSPPAKRRKRESIIDASEDSQLEAAIAASLKESSAEQNDKHAEENADEDSLTEFTESESDSENVSKTFQNNDEKKEMLKNNEHLKCNENRTEPEKNMTSENDSKTKESSTGGEPRKANEQVKLKDEGNHDDSEEDDVDSDIPKASLMLRYPNGKRKLKTFPAEATIIDLIKYVETQGFSNERYELVTNFPRKKLSYLNSDLSLKDAGLFPRETVFIQER